jgi:hypothetical protein
MRPNGIGKHNSQFCRFFHPQTDRKFERILRTWKSILLRPVTTMTNLRALAVLVGLVDLDLLIADGAPPRPSILYILFTAILIRKRVRPHRQVPDLCPLRVIINQISKLSQQHHHRTC